MQAKILDADEFEKYFSFDAQDVSYSVKYDTENSENYFNIQLFLPKSFFDLDCSNVYLSAHEINRNITENIFLNLELFAIGQLGTETAYIFRPWVIGIENSMIVAYLENFHLFIHGKLFHNLLERLLFIELLSKDNLYDIRILEEIPVKTFQRFGLDSTKLDIDSNSFNTRSNLQISRLTGEVKEKVTEFYKKNWNELTPNLEIKYFRPLLSTWFEIKNKNENKIVGYIRLYNSNVNFNGGFNLEYLISKEDRNKGYATEGVIRLIEILKTFSFAMRLSAEVNDDNYFSISLLKKVGFEPKETGIFSEENYTLSITNSINDLCNNCKNGKLDVSVYDFYIDRYPKYFE